MKRVDLLRLAKTFSAAVGANQLSSYKVRRKHFSVRFEFGIDVLGMKDDRMDAFVMETSSRN